MITCQQSRKKAPGGRPVLRLSQRECSAPPRDRTTQWQQPTGTVPLWHGSDARRNRCDLRLASHSATVLIIMIVLVAAPDPCRQPSGRNLATQNGAQHRGNPSHHAATIGWARWRTGSFVCPSIARRGGFNASHGVGGFKLPAPLQFAEPPA